MNRLAAIAVALTLAWRAHGAAPKAPLTADLRGKVYADDIIVLTVAPETRDIGWTDVKLRSENLTITQAGEKYEPEPNDHNRVLFTYQAVPNGAGPAWVEGDVQHGSDPAEALPRITFDVMPDLARASDDPKVIFAKQRAAKRPLFYVRATAQPSRVFVGQQVDLAWDAIAVDREMQVHSLEPKLPEELHVQSLGSTYPTMTAAGGTFVSHTRIGHVLLHPSAPGIVRIPAMQVRAWKPGPDRSDIEFVRWTNAVDIEVVAPPAAAANLPLGHFRMQCTGVASGDFWPRFNITVTGSGDLTTARPPRFGIPPSNPIVMLAELPGYQGSRGAEKEWSAVLHTNEEEVELPAIYFDFFNPDTGAVEQASCVGLRQNWPARRLYRESSVARSAREKTPDRAAAGFLMLRYFAAVLALGGVVIVAMAARP